MCFFCRFLTGNDVLSGEMKLLAEIGGKISFLSFNSQKVAIPVRFRSKVTILEFA